MVGKIEQVHKEWLDDCRYFLADKGYDDTKLIDQLKGNGITPFKNIRNCWKDGEEIRQYRNTYLIYNYKGDVWYVEENGADMQGI